MDYQKMVFGCTFCLKESLQERVTLLEYSMNAVTEGIDAIATTRVLIRGENSSSATHAHTGEQVSRTFRYFCLNLPFK